MFRKSYAAKMTEIIEECEKSLRVNAETISNCITEFAVAQKQNNDEVAQHIERLHKVNHKQLIDLLGYQRFAAERLRREACDLAPRI